MVGQNQAFYPANHHFPAGMQHLMTASLVLSLIASRPFFLASIVQKGSQRIDRCWTTHKNRAYVMLCFCISQ